MYSGNCGCSIWLTISTFLAVITAGLFFLGFIPNVQIALYVIIGIAIISLFLLINSLNSCCTRRRCFENYGTCILIGAIGTIIFAILSLSFTLTVGSILSAIFLGLTVFFFILTLASTIGLIISLLNANSITENDSCGCGNNRSCPCNRNR